MCVANELGRANALSQYPHISFLASPCSWAPCLTRLRVGPLGRSFLVGAVACQAVPARAYQRGGSGGGMLIHSEPQTSCHNVGMGAFSVDWECPVS